MKAPPTISARWLHHTVVKLRDRALIGASVFPMFDREGNVWKVIVAWRGSSRVLLLDYTPGRFHHNWWGIVADASLSEERPLSARQAFGVHRLWHFDPWWVLKDKRYLGRTELAPLKESNLVARCTRTIYRMNFEGDLSRVHSVATERLGKTAPLDPGVLPVRKKPPERQEPAKRMVWKVSRSW